MPVSWRFKFGSFNLINNASWISNLKVSQCLRIITVLQRILSLVKLELCLVSKWSLIAPLLGASSGVGSGVALLLEKLLLSCTTKCPFTHINEKLYLQQDGVSMGSPLGVTLSNFYMVHIENNIMNNLPNRPTLYCRFVDDCFIVKDNIDSLLRLKNLFPSLYLNSLTK